MNGTVRTLKELKARESDLIKRRDEQRAKIQEKYKEFSHPVTIATYISKPILKSLLKHITWTPLIISAGKALFSFRKKKRRK